MSEGTSVRAGNKRRVQVRKERRDGFTAKRKQVFFDLLAACCDVTRAAAAADLAGSGVHFVHLPRLARLSYRGRAYPLS